MSEYQFYDFRVLDKPLNQKQMDELRKISTRATITRNSLTNTYHYGDFKGNPLDLMEDYFDAHLYYANFGCRTLMLRFPREALALPRLKAYTNSLIVLHERADWVILAITMSFEAQDDVEVDEGLLDELCAFRKDLLAGDDRLLFLAWLASLTAIDSESAFDIIPPIPPKMGRLEDRHKSLIQFFCLDSKLLDVAVADLSAAPVKSMPQKSVTAWLKLLSAAEVTAYLERLFNEEATTVQNELIARYTRETIPPAPVTSQPKRTGSQLLDAAYPNG
jgi:hypothetical protein